MSFYKSILQPLFNYLTPEEKRKGIWVVALMMFNAILDFFSVASLLPLIFLLVNPSVIQSNKYFHFLYSRFGFLSSSQFTITLASGVLIFSIVKTIFSLAITQSKAKFCFTLGSELCSRMLSRFMESSYLDYTQLDFSKELNRIANLPLSFANNIVMPLTTLLSEGIVFIILLVCIALYQIQVFFMLLLIFAPLLLFVSVRRKRITKTSNDLKEQYPLTLKYALQIVEGLVEIKTVGKESFFKERFKKASNMLANTFVRDHVQQTGATRIAEIIASTIICSLIIFSVVANQNYQQTIVLLSVYAGVSFRMIPSINRILNAMTQIKSHEFLFTELTRLTSFQEAQNENQVPILFTKTIEIKNIFFQFSGGPKILQDVSITIYKGERIALVGKSGSGKTTLLMVLLKFLQASAGTILVDGHDPDPSIVLWRKLFGYVSQSPYILDASIAENIAFGSSEDDIDLKKIHQLILDLDLEEMINQFPDGMQTQIGEKGIKLSGGQRQRIAIARALYYDAEILLLDEITNQLDSQTEQEILKTLEKIQKKTILMITHHSHLLTAFDRVLTLEDGFISEKIIS